MEDFCEMVLKRRKMSSEKGETSSAMSKNVYEVFLSFRGPDTRQGFTDCLYHAMIDAGINVFRDDDELRPGDKLVEILTAIDNSKLCVVVFSRTFAASAWCLREVERMIGMKKEIVPIFYDVTPDDVKLKTLLYNDALTMHENTGREKEEVQQWREALKEIPRFKGRELKNYSGFVEFNRQFIKEILTKLKLNMKFDIPELVEVPDEVDDALKSLNIESHDERRFLGIHGMGGIGKTTLAKIVFNQISDSFDCSCFLENVRDGLSQGHDGLPKMQEKLLKSLNPSSIDVKKNFTNKKAIIVLDDIAEKSQIHGLVGDSGWFGLGSRIIFTTRKARLHEQVSSSNATFQGLEKKEMNSKQALELFSKHAFGRDSPSEDFKDLSNKVISVTTGLPLALEVVGSFLCRQNAKVWRSTIKKLKEAPVQDVQRKLRLSYDALEPEQQEIFLDIACFFIGVDKKYAVYMWEACDFYPVELLISMSLIKVTSLRVKKEHFWVHEKCFWMHDQLRDLGRAIVNEKYGDSRAGSRLCINEDTLDQLKGNSGKERIEAIQLRGSGPFGPINLDRDVFIGLKKLRFLKLKSIGNFSGEFAGLLPKLRWLSLSHMSFNATNLCLKQLAVLELRQCRFGQGNCRDLELMISENLKVLTIEMCRRLTSMIDLSKLVNLERLELCYCDNLTSIPSSVWNLRYLKHLALTCSCCRPRPRHWDCCRNVKNWNVPKSIGHLACLTTLTLRCEILTELPQNIGELVKLKHLSLWGCKALKVVPKSIGDLRRLVSLNLSNTGIIQVPTTIGQLTKLKTLDLSRCSSLHSLPNSVGNLQSLIDLNLGGSGIKRLPSSFGDLASLQKLRLTDSRVTSLPVSIRDLEKLQVLDIGTRIEVKTWIDEVPELPTGLTKLWIYIAQKIQRLSNLINLTHLVIDNIGIFARPKEFPAFVVIEGIENLSKLKHMELACFVVKSLSMELSALQQLKSLKLHCPKLEFWKCQLPSSLESLDLKVKDWGELLLNLPSLENLTKLDLTHLGSDEVEAMEQETGYAKSVSMDLSALQKLKSMKLHCRKLEFRKCQLPSSLELLDLKVKDWGELPLNLPSLKNLSRLDLINYGADEVEGMEEEAGYPKSISMDLSALQKLKSLKLTCSKLEFRQCQLPSSLESLVLEVKQRGHGQLPINLSSLKNLSALWLTNFLMERIDEIEGLESLEKLYPRGCVVKFNCFPVLRNLRDLDLSSCKFSSKSLDVSQLDRLQSLSIENATGLVEISGTGNLEKLWIGDCRSFQRMKDISKLNRLKEICIYNCSNFLGIDGIERLFSAQTSVRIYRCKCEDF